MKRTLALAALAFGLLAPTALAGGWATAGLSSLPPAGAGPGDEWKTQITLLQHGRTPLENVSPAIVVTNAAGKDTRFDATPTDKPGVYDVTVSFPTAGKYTYTVDDGFGNAFPHDFAPVTIGENITTTAPASAPAAPPPASDDGLPLASYLLGGLALLLGGAAVTSAMRARRARGAGQAQPA